MLKVVFLYTEIAGYFLSCTRKLTELHPAEVHIFRYPVNKEAPFLFSSLQRTRFYERGDFSEKKLLDTIAGIKPDLIYCAGWIDKEYLKVIKSFAGKIPTVLGFDNKWENSLKQNIAALLAPFLLTKHFSHCFVPGEKQKKYALKLGFKEDRIITGLYSADYDLFHRYYSESFSEKKSSFPKKFLYAARYVKHKGIEDLWNAFIELQNEHPNEWELCCVGTGEVPPLQHPKIKHFGFIQPEQLGDIIRNTGVYVLPSHFEPWGVSLQEFAAAGFPLICSNQVGAAEKFLEPGANGFLFEAGNINQLKEGLKKITGMPEKMLLEMAEKSVEKSRQITPELWADKLIGLLKD